MPETKYNIRRSTVLPPQAARDMISSREMGLNLRFLTERQPLSPTPASKMATSRSPLDTPTGAPKLLPSRRGTQRHVVHLRFVQTCQDQDEREA
jgi:hypothetical protein